MSDEAPYQIHAVQPSDPVADMLGAIFAKSGGLKRQIYSSSASVLSSCRRRPRFTAADAPARGATHRYLRDAAFAHHHRRFSRHVRHERPRHPPQRYSIPCRQHSLLTPFHAALHVCQIRAARKECHPGATFTEALLNFREDIDIDAIIGMLI